MDSTIKILHSYWAYLVVIVLFAAVINALAGLLGKKEYSAKDFRVSLFTLIVSHIQLLLGLILYFVSPRFSDWSELGGKVMSDSVTKYYEMVESGEIDPRQMPIKQDDKIYIVALENKLNDIAWHLQEYYGNMSDKDYLINKRFIKKT